MSIPPGGTKVIDIIVEAIMLFSIFLAGAYMGFSVRNGK